MDSLHAHTEALEKEERTRKFEEYLCFGRQLRDPCGVSSKPFNGPDRTGDTGVRAANYLGKL